VQLQTDRLRHLRILQAKTLIETATPGLMDAEFECLRRDWLGAFVQNLYVAVVDVRAIALLAGDLSDDA